MEFSTSFREDKRSGNQSALLCCKIFISESRNRAVLDIIEQVARNDPEVVITNKFEDRAYNRTRYTIVSHIVRDSLGSAIYSPLQQTVVAIVEAAYATINLELHSGTHPRLGVVDDILFHPLGQASLDEAAWIAKATAADIGTRFRVPVFLYAAAHPTGRALDTVRRELNYYRPNSLGIQWEGWTINEVLTVQPDEGPSQVRLSTGITMIGARPWVALYNIPIATMDFSIARRIARMVSARGGGLPTVQTMALAHGDGVTEIACMLLDPSRVGADRVQTQVEMLAAEEGLDVEKGYYTDYSPEMIVEKYIYLISSHRDM